MTNNTISTITRKQVEDDHRICHTAKLFGIHFPLRLEPFIYDVTGRLCREYSGGYWQFYTLSNGGFYMAPDSDTVFQVTCESGYEGELSADALGITACLYAYSHLSLTGNCRGFPQACAQQYHWLRAYMLEHSEARDILRATD